MTLLRLLTLSLLALFVPFNAARAQVTYTQIDYPGAESTSVTGINVSGEMVGWYQQTLGAPNHAFILNNGQFTSFDYPGAAETFANAINDNGQIVGTEVNVNGRSQAFIYDGQTFTSIAYPGASTTEGNGINNAGDVAIRAGALGIRLRGFKYSGGKFTPVIPPGNFAVDGAYGINNVGQLVGYRTNQDRWDSFLQQNGKFTFIDIGDAATAFSINDSGQVAGSYSVAAVQSGFVWKNGTYTTLAFPGAVNTSALGISKAGVVVGSFNAGIYTADHGFVTSAIP